MSVTTCSDIQDSGLHTRGQALLKLVGLLGVGEDQSVEVSLAADLELDLLAALVLLDPGGCERHVRNSFDANHPRWLGSVPSLSRQ